MSTVTPVIAANVEATAVSTIAWATEHGDQPFADEGRAQLRGLLSGHR